MTQWILIASLFICCACSDSNGSHQHHPAPDVGLPDTIASDTAVPDSQTDTSEPTLTPLVDMYAFVPAEGAADPWSADAPGADDICAGEDLKAETTPEGDWFDVHTEFCTYSTVATPVLVDIAEGDVVQVAVYFSSIVEGDGPYTLGAALGDPADIIWEESVTVPAEDTVLTGTWVATRAIAAGEPAYFHVSNHGENIWSLVRFARVD